MQIDWPGEKLLIRLLETAEKSCIGLARPWLIRRDESARTASAYQNKMALGQAEEDLAEIKAGRARYDPAAGRLVPLVRPFPIQPTPPALPVSSASGSTPPSLPTQPIPRLGSALDFATHALLQSTVKEMERTLNLERILQRAEAETVGVPDDAVSESSSSPDWISRWRDSAQDVTDEQVQLLWARILVGEIQKPGRFSLRTLDFLRSISRTEAQIIERLAKLVINNAFVFRDETILETRGLSINNLLKLQTIGVLSGAEGVLSWVLKPATNNIPHSCVSHGLGIRIHAVATETNIPCCPLSEVGVELCSLSPSQGDLEYMRVLARFLGSLGLRCQLGEIVTHGRQPFEFSGKQESFGPTDVADTAKQ